VGEIGDLFNPGAPRALHYFLNHILWSAKLSKLLRQLGYVVLVLLLETK
jgi:hypothetical protein